MMLVVTGVAAVHLNQLPFSRHNPSFALGTFGGQHWDCQFASDVVRHWIVYRVCRPLRCCPLLVPNSTLLQHIPGRA